MSVKFKRNEEMSKNLEEAKKAAIKDSHKTLNDIAKKNIIIIIVSMAVGLTIFLLYFFWGLSIISNKEEASNGRNFGINYERKYYPPLTTDK